MTPGTRVRCVSYEGIPPKNNNMVIGVAGMVTSTNDMFVDVLLDEPLINMDAWLFHHYELEEI